MIYQYACNTCESRAEVHRSIANRNSGPTCHCGAGQMEKRIFTPSMVAMPDWNMSYRDPSTKEIVTSEAGRQDMMKRHGLMDAREMDTPSFSDMREEHKEFHAVANKEAPDDLKRAMVKEGHGDLL
jgi:putative FmdB family regulatory protein